MAIVDLSFPIRPHSRWKVAPERVANHASGDPLQSTVVTISCHAYTHVDAPLPSCPTAGTSPPCPSTSGSATRRSSTFVYSEWAGTSLSPVE